MTKEVAVGPKPNGLAWDCGRRRLLVADVRDFRARLVDPESGSVVAETTLPGRPRWCVFDPDGDRFLVNIRETALIAIASGIALVRWKVSNPVLVAVTAVIGLVGFEVLKPTWVFVK